MQLPMCPKAVHYLSEKNPHRIDFRLQAILLQLFYLASYDNQISLGSLRTRECSCPCVQKQPTTSAKKNPDRIDFRVQAILLQLFHLASYDNQISFGSLRTRKCSCPCVQKQSTTYLKKILIEWIFVFRLFYHNSFILHPTTTKSALVA